MKIKNKILSTVMLMAMIVLLVGCIALLNLKSVKSSFDFINRELAPTVDTAEDLIQILMELEKTGSDIIHQKSFQEVDNLKDSYTQSYS